MRGRPRGGPGGSGSWGGRGHWPFVGAAPALVASSCAAAASMPPCGRLPGALGGRRGLVPGAASCPAEHGLRQKQALEHARVWTAGLLACASACRVIRPRLLRCDPARECRRAALGPRVGRVHLRARLGAKPLRAWPAAVVPRPHERGVRGKFRPNTGACRRRHRGSISMRLKGHALVGAGCSAERRGRQPRAPRGVLHRFKGNDGQAEHRQVAAKPGRCHRRRQSSALGPDRNGPECVPPPGLAPRRAQRAGVIGPAATGGALLELSAPRRFKRERTEDDGPQTAGRALTTLRSVQLRGFRGLVWQSRVCSTSARGVLAGACRRTFPWPVPAIPTIPDRVRHIVPGWNLTILGGVPGEPWRLALPSLRPQQLRRGPQVFRSLKASGTWPNALSARAHGIPSGGTLCRTTGAASRAGQERCRRERPAGDSPSD